MIVRGAPLIGGLAWGSTLDVNNHQLPAMQADSALQCNFSRN
jgi:hypothetical protein